MVVGRWWVGAANLAVGWRLGEWGARARGAAGQGVELRDP